MSEYLFCTSDPRTPNVIAIRTSKDDPREDSFTAKVRRRELGSFQLEWTLRVVNRDLSEQALRKALRSYRDRSDKTAFACDPMVARGEAVKLTTLRPEMVRKKRGLLRRLFRAA